MFLTIQYFPSPKFCSLQITIFEIFNISESSVINVEAAKVLWQYPFGKGKGWVPIVGFPTILNITNIPC